MWSTRLASEALSPPAGDGDRVFMRTGDGKVYGLEAATGTEQWMVDRTVPSLTLRGLSAPVVVGNRVYGGLARSEEDTYELQAVMRHLYHVYLLYKKNTEKKK